MKHPAMKLKELIKSNKILVMPGAYDALSARLIERAGFDAVQVSGFGVSASYLGMTDASFTNLTDIFMITRNIVNAVNIPVMTDADTGYGNAVNTAWTVRQLGLAGAAGVNLEDQVFPKICGNLEGKALISLDEMVGKIKAAVDHKVHPDFIINARTDAVGVTSVEDAIKRGNAYVEAGADMIYISSPPSVEIIKRLVKEIKAPISINMKEGGVTPDLTVKEFEDLGVARVSVPLTTMFAAARGIELALDYLKEKGTAEHYEGLMSFEELNDITDEQLVRSQEIKYGVQRESL
ncbi:isocitrate lyase/PEP mutase family protein [Ureibacillus manganicus]|uniref:isocitrate lyase/PEP mutase family protein n=1 Tax=Ureibacillus manganicus TaxID=1266064 RepID=UPI00055BE2C5|nr:oxaloacetate decarboxylase [Ureibacillus manganicus]